MRASVLEVEAAVADAQRWLIQVNTELRGQKRFLLLCFAWLAGVERVSTSVNVGIGVM